MTPAVGACEIPPPREAAASANHRFQLITASGDDWRIGALTCSIPYPARKAREARKKGLPISASITQLGLQQDQVPPEEAEFLA